MTGNTLLKLSLALAAVLVISSCTHPRERRIQENPAVFNALPMEQQAAVRNGHVLTGMSTDAVYLSLGNPSETSAGSHEGKTAETWIYQGVRAVPDYSRSYYYDPYYGPGPSLPDYNYIPYNRAIITFLNQRVVAVQQRR